MDKDKGHGRSVSEILAEQYARIFEERFSSINPDNWRKPWIAAVPCPAQNISGNVYSGGNQFFLSLVTSIRGWEHPLFLTDRQCARLGLKVNRGEHAFPIACVKIWMKDTSEMKRPSISPEKWKTLPENEQQGYVRSESLLYFRGYNIAQTDFALRLPERMESIRMRYSEITAELTNDVTVPEIDRCVRDQSWLCPIRETRGDSAFFSRSGDSITVPLREQFPDRAEFYSTLLHEMTHSTGTPERLARDMEGFFGTEKYAREELVAELSSAILCTRAGIGATISEHNLQYLRSWTEVIGSDPGALTGTIQDASRAADLIADTIGLGQRRCIDLSDMRADLEKGNGKDNEMDNTKDDEKNKEKDKVKKEDKEIEKEKEKEIHKHTVNRL